MAVPRSLDDLSSSLRLSRRSLFRWNRTVVVVISVVCFGTFFYLVGQLPDVPSSSSSPVPLFPPPPHPPIANPALFAGFSPGINSIQTTDEVNPSDWASLLAPDDPPLSSLPVRHEWFPELEHTPATGPPVFNPFPEDKLKELYPDQPPEDKPTPEPLKVGRGGRKLSKFASSWRRPKMGEPWREQPNVQADESKFVQGRRGREEMLQGRREVIRNGFLVAWEGYKKTSWGHDEVRPNTGMPSDPFNGWGATIIDSLDTLLLMDLPAEYTLAREHVRLLDFSVITGRSSSKGFLYETGAFGQRSDVLEERFWPRIPVFETTIRYLGGLLGAYDLTGDDLMLRRAEELAEILLPAFDTPTGIPYGSIRPGRPFVKGTEYQVSLAEAGSMTLEMTRLSQITGNWTYFDRVQRVTDVIDQDLSKRSTYPPLLPTTFDPDETGELMGIFTFGGSADSYYEYLIKQHQLLNGRLPQYARMYKQALDRAYSTIIRVVKSVPGRTLVTIGEIKQGLFEGSLEHLTCFAGAMLALGSRLLSRPGDLDTARDFTQTCYYVGAITDSGLQPEKVTFFPPDDPKQFISMVDREGKVMYQKPAGRPFGIKESTPKYIGRPETIESVFYMYRMTGDPIWQDKGWRMFTSWANASLVEFGFSSINDVRSTRPARVDNMESFVLAETLKYHYLLQSPSDLLPLDDYVLNTEAHPFLSNPSITPGSQNLWSPSTPPSHPLHPEDTSRPDRSGTSAQLWATHKRLPRPHTVVAQPAGKVEVFRPVAPLRNGPGKQQAVGGGMGGGGGRPRQNG